jgi:thiamine pyrophosphate-dependent acetolactate synthase large subunit-like protein
MLSRLNEDMIRKLAAQFNTLPDMLQVAIGDYVPAEESPCFYKGYVTALITIATLSNEQKIPINYDVLVAIAGKAAQLQQQLLDEEEDTAWLDQLNSWVDANYKTELTRTQPH